MSDCVPVDKAFDPTLSLLSLKVIAASLPVNVDCWYRVNRQQYIRVVIQLVNNVLQSYVALYLTADGFI